MFLQAEESKREKDTGPKAEVPPETTTSPMEDEGPNQEAVKEKELGNAAYKAKCFDKAIQHYDAAIELDDSDISFLTNRCRLALVNVDA